MRFLCLTMLFLLLSCAKPPRDDQQAKEKTNSEISSISAQFTDLDGAAFDLDHFKGRPVLVNYWATWCVPCLKEFPSFVALQDALRDDEMTFLFASPDKLDRIRAFKQDKGYDLEFLHLNLSLDKLEIYALPSTFIFSSNGELYKRIDGAMDWNTPEVIQMLKEVP